MVAPLSDEFPRYVWQRRALARRDDTSATTLNRLVIAARTGAAMYRDVSVREAVAQNFRARPDTLSVLAQDGDEDVRQAAAANPFTPLAARAALVHDKSSAVGAIAARSAGMAERIAAANRSPAARNVFDLRKADEAVASLIRNDDLSEVTGGQPDVPEVLAVLAHSRNDAILNRVIRSSEIDPSTLAFLERLLAPDASDFPAVYRATLIAAHRRAPSPLLEALARHRSVEVRTPVARNENTSSATLTTLAGDQAMCVVAAAAGNPSTGAETLQRLASHPDGPSEQGGHHTGSMTTVHVYPTRSADIRSAIAGNPSTPATALAELARNGHHDRVAGNRAATAEILTWIAKHTSSRQALEGVASHPNTPSRVLAKIAEEEDDDEYVCEDVAGNPNTPAETLHRLREHWNAGVRAAAFETLSSAARRRR